MKTIQELYSEIMASEELKDQFIEAAKAGKQEEFLKAHGCGATLQEVQAFLTAKQSEDAPLSFDELENAAGGECHNRVWLPWDSDSKLHVERSSRVPGKRGRWPDVQQKLRGGFSHENHSGIV